MRTWLHRGFVGAIALVMIAACVGLVMPPGPHELTPPWIRVFHDAKGDTSVVPTIGAVRLESGILKWRITYLTTPKPTKPGTWEIKLRGFELSHIYPWPPGGINADIYAWIKLEIPLWMILILLSWFPCIVVRRWLCHKRRIREHGCLRCHYDLTGNESGTCPECGAEFDGADSEHRLTPIVSPMPSSHRR